MNYDYGCRDLRARSLLLTGVRRSARREPAAKRKAKAKAHPAPGGAEEGQARVPSARALADDSAASLAAALQGLGLTTDAGPMPGVAHDSSSGHEKDPWRSIVRERRNDDFALPVKRFATSAAATLRTLVYRNGSERVGVSR